MTLQYDREFFQVLEPLLPALSAVPKPAVGDVESRRARVEALFGPLLGILPDSPDVEHSVFHTEADDGHSVDIHRFSKKDSAAPDSGPAIVHIHGGGYIALKVSYFEKYLAALVSECGVQLFSVEYRLAPESPFPTPVEDCYAGLVWVQEHAKEFNIDPARIAVMGESAGGGLAAALALLARDRKFSPPLAKQILIYPMLDDRNLTPNPAIEPLAFWDNADNITGWTAYVGGKAEQDDVSPYAAPARVESVEGLPPTYIDVGELDIFREENMNYAIRLLAANISTEFHLYPGVPHGFELLSRNTSVTKRCLENRLKAVTSF